jgi:hypothetical protein
MRVRLAPLWCATALLGLALPARAQQTAAGASHGTASRQELQRLLQLYDQAAASSAYSDSLRAQSRLDARAIRERLARGDFHVGDRIQLAVEGEATLTQTFVVGPDLTVYLPNVGDVPLTGVLRSELEPYLRTEIGKILPNHPVVRVHSFIQIVLSGAVARPGFYAAPANALVSDALVEAGGPLPTARLDEISIERHGRRLWSGSQVTQAIIQGRTLNALGVEPGDQIVVPQRGPGWLSSVTAPLSMLTALMTLPISVYTWTRVF